MRWRIDELGRNTQTLLIAFSESEELQAYASSQNIPMTILQDTGQDVYKSYGLAKGTFANLWGFKTLRRYIKIMRKEGMENFRAPVEDWQQLGGDFVIAPDGTLTYGYWSGGPGDRPSFETLQTEIAMVYRGQGNPVA